MCAVLTVVVGSVLAVLHFWFAHRVRPPPLGDDVVWREPNGTTHDAFWSGVHHLMLLLHITAVGIRAMD